MKKKKIMVMTALYMSDYTGSVFVVSEFAKYFVQLGYKVYIFTFNKDRKIVHSMCPNKNIRVINLKKCWFIPKINADLIIGFHHEVFDSLIASKKVNAKKIIYFSLSPYENAEKISSYHNIFTKIYCNSWETAQIRNVEVPDRKLEVFNNSVTPEFINTHKQTYEKHIKKIAVVSNRGLFLPDSEFHKLATKAGLNITFFGVHSGNYKKIEPSDLIDFDAIISIGRTVQYALCLGIPVFCYDRFGGPGYITLDNWRNAEKMNYSGRTKPIENKDLQKSLIQKPDSERIVHDLINDYPRVLQDVQELRKIAITRYDLYKNLDKMMQDIGESHETKK